MGIDPGTTVMGYSIIGIKGNKIELLTIGILRLNKYDDHALRLKNIFDRTIMLIDEYHPDELAIEAPFYGKNVQSMLKLGRRRVWPLLQPYPGRSPFSNMLPARSSNPSPARAMLRKSRFRRCSSA
jgi:Holliday junction resolvasome RuvABC endonuclease subunit